MAREVDKVVRSLVELRPTAILEFFEIITPGDEAVVLRIHGGANVKEEDEASGKRIIAKSIIWGGNQYFPMAIESSGFETTSTTRLPRPKIRVSNIYYAASMFLRDHNNLKDSKVIRTKVFLKYLDDENFGLNPDGESKNPYGEADPEAIISRDEYIISQKTAENKNFVEFELNSPLDLENADTLKRLVIGRYCSWKYRGFGCRFSGNYPVCKSDNSDFSATPNYSKVASDAECEWVYGKTYNKGDIAYVNDKSEILNKYDEVLEYRKVYYVAIADDPFVSYIDPGNDETNWEQDACSKTIEGCKKRFHEKPVELVVEGDTDIYEDRPLPFGGFPGTDNYYYGR